MYKVIKRMEIAGSHRLNLPYQSPCGGLHGHNWIVKVQVEGEKLNESGMLIDFTKIKEKIHFKLDHTCLNDVAPFNRINPTAENMAKWIGEQIIDEGVFCSRVEVQESEGNIAIWEA